MKRFFFAAVLLSILGTVSAFAQEKEQKTTEQVVAEQVEKLEKELNLSPEQAFWVDSILSFNYASTMEEYDRLNESGMRNAESYKAVHDKWEKRTEEAMKKALTEQQYIGFLRYVGKGKEYKKAKDGTWVLKKGAKKEPKEKK